MLAVSAIVLSLLMVRFEPTGLAAHLGWLVALLAVQRGQTWGAIALVGIAAAFATLAACGGIALWAPALPGIAMLGSLAWWPRLWRYDRAATAVLLVAATGLGVGGAWALASTAAGSPAIAVSDIARDKGQIQFRRRSADPIDTWVGRWIKRGGYEYAEVTIARDEADRDRLTVLFRSGGCLGGEEFSRTATVVGGVLVLDRPVEEYSSDHYQTLYLSALPGKGSLILIAGPDRAWVTEMLHTANTADVTRSEHKFDVMLIKRNVFQREYDLDEDDLY